MRADIRTSIYNPTTRLLFTGNFSIKNNTVTNSDRDISTEITKLIFELADISLFFENETKSFEFFPL